MYHLPLPTEGILETKLYVNRFLYGVSSLHNILFIFLVLLFYVNESYRICSPVTCSFFIYFHCCRICCCMTIQLIYLSTISGHLNLSLFSILNNDVVHIFNHVSMCNQAGVYLVNV